MRAYFAILVSATVLNACGPQRAPDKDQPVKPSPITEPEKISDTLKPVRTTEELFQYDKVDGLNWLTKEQCAVDICGAPSEAPAVSAQVQADGDQILSHIRELARRAIDDRRAGDTALGKAIDAHHDELKNVKLDDRHLAVVNYFWVVANSEALDAAYDWDAGVFDTEKLRSSLKEMSDENRSLLMEMAKVLFDSPEIKISGYLKEVGLQAYFEKLTNSKDPAVVRAKEQEFAKDLIARIESLSKSMPGLPIQVRPATLALSRGQTIDAADLSEIANNVREAGVETLVDHQTALFSKRKVDFENYVNAFDVLQPILKSYYQDDVKIEKGFGETIEKCRVVSLNIAKQKATPTPDSSLIFEKVRGQALLQVSQFTSDARISAAVRLQLQNVKFNMPKNPNELMRKIESSYLSISAEGRLQVENAQRAGVQDLAVLISAQNASATSITKDHFTVADPCIEQDPLFPSDDAIEDFAVINSSYATLSQPKYAYGVIAHELGHVVSKKIKSMITSHEDPTFYTSVLQCIDARQPIAKKKPTSEEDFADFFASKVVAELSKATPGISNTNCLLLEQNGTRWGSRAGLSMYWPSTHSDRHSTDLNRAIQGEIDAGHSLSSYCQSVVDQTIPTMSTKCL